MLEKWKGVMDLGSNSGIEVHALYAQKYEFGLIYFIAHASAPHGVALFISSTGVLNQLVKAPWTHL